MLTCELPTSFHTGGDELNLNSYLLDETVKSNDFKVLRPLIQKLVDRNHDQLRKYGLSPVVWEEMALSWNLTLGKDVVVQTWLSAASVAEVTQRGYKALVGSYDFWVRNATVQFLLFAGSRICSISIAVRDSG